MANNDNHPQLDVSLIWQVNAQVQQKYKMTQAFQGVQSELQLHLWQRKCFNLDCASCEHKNNYTTGVLLENIPLMWPWSKTSTCITNINMSKYYEFIIFHTYVETVSVI